MLLLLLALLPLAFSLRIVLPTPATIWTPPFSGAGRGRVTWALTNSTDPLTLAILLIQPHGEVIPLATDVQTAQLTWNIPNELEILFRGLPEGGYKIVLTNQEFDEIYVSVGPFQIDQPLLQSSTSTSISESLHLPNPKFSTTVSTSPISLLSSDDSTSALTSSRSRVKTTTQTSSTIVSVTQTITITSNLSIIPTSKSNDKPASSSSNASNGNGQLNSTNPASARFAIFSIVNLVFAIFTATLIPIRHVL